jgi:hypothetical protein
MKGITSDQDVSALHVEAPGVLGRLEATGRELQKLRIWLGLASLLLGELALLCAFVLADWMWVLPTAIRALGVAAMAALLLMVFLRPHRRSGREQTAALVESNFPELGQRLRTVVEYAQPTPTTVPASPGLLKALGRQTDHHTAKLDFRKLIPWAAFERRAVVFCLASMFGLVTLFLSPSLRMAVSRMLLLPVHYTTVDVLPGDLTLKAGDELKLKVTLSGRPVSSAHWSYRTQKDGEWTSVSLAPDRAPGQPDQELIGNLSAGLKDCQTNFDYRVVAGEVESPVFHVRVVHPLRMKGLEATITPPPYTRRQPDVVKEGSFQAVEGSRVEFTVTLDRAPTTAALVLGSPEEASRQTIPLQIEGARLTGELPPITKGLLYEIAAVADDGMKLEAEPFRIKVRTDLKPTIRFIRPEESLAVTPTTEVPMQVEAGDDFGVSRLGIRYKVGDGPEETLHLADYKDQPVTANALATLYLEKHPLTYNDGITYYAFAEDNYPPQPHRVVSELRFIDILPYKQAYELVEGGGTCNGSTSLEELIARQRVNLNRTFAFEKDERVPDETARRLARFEEELASATAEFAQGLSALAGPIPALDEAASAMQTATELLTAKDLPAARPREEAALKGLISTRQNLRKLLSQKRSNQASACRQFDQRQTQKLRRLPEDQSKKNLARLENDLRELARKEQKFSEEIEPRGGGGPQLDSAQQEERQAKKSKKSSSKASSKRPGSGSSRRATASASQSTQDRPSLAEQQRQAVEEADRLRRLAKTDEALTELTNRRLEAAAQAIREANRSIQADRPAESAEAAGDAARKLESVARQVGALKARELADRLARQRDLAQALAKAERALGQVLEKDDESKQTGSAPEQRLAEQQRGLADEVAALADVLKRLKMAAALENRELAQTIDRAALANPPEEVEESMRRNADAIGGGRKAQAAKGAEGAALRLDALARDLESARRDTIAPQLSRLLAAEKQAAELQERLRSVRQSSQQAEAEKGMSDLAHLLENIAPGEGSLREAAQNLVNATQSSHSGWTRADKIQEGEGGYFVPPVVYTQKLSAAVLALQAKIQEIVLDNALVERTGPVPPQYKDLVEDYYRVLSQDLR